MQEVKAEYEAKCKVIEEKRGAIKAELDKAHE